MALRKLHSRDSRDALCSDCAGFDLLRVKPAQDKSLDLATDLDIEGKPASRVLRLARAFLYKSVGM